MLRSYRPIPCLHCRCTGEILFGERLLHLSLIHRQKHFHHLGAPPKITIITIGFFSFQFRSRGAFECYADFSANDISYEGVALTFHLVLVDATVDCSPRASLNFVQFIWNNIKTFAFIKYAIVCVPLETPKILFLRHYRAIGGLIISAQHVADFRKNFQI